MARPMRGSTREQRSTVVYDVLSFVAILVVVLFLIVTRSGSDDVQLVTTGAVSTQAPNLVWRSATGAASYVVELRREDGTLLARGTTADTVFAVPDSVRAGPDSDAYWAVTARLSDGTSLSSTARRIRLTP